MLTITNQAHPLWLLPQEPSFTSTYQAHLPKCLNCRRLLCACEISRRVVSSSRFNSLPCRGNKTDARPLLTQKQFTEISDHELGAPNKIYRGLHPSGPAAALIRLKCWHNYKFLPYHELLQWKGRLWGPPLPVGEISTWRELGRTIWTYEDGGYGHTRELSCDLIILVKTGTFIWDQNVRKITHF